jgi:hypothetical protein
VTVDQLPGISVDPIANPDLANAISRAVMDDDPIDKPVLIAGPPDGTVTLPGGYVRDDGTLVREATVRELCGADEEELSKQVYSRDFAKLIDELLHRCVLTIGNQTATREMLDSLLIGDRDTLLQAIRVATYGDAMRIQLSCPVCEHKFKVEYRFSEDVSIRQMQDYVVELEDGQKITLDAEERFYLIPLRRGGNAEVELITGGVQRHVYNAETSKLSTAERNTLLLQQCVKTIRGEAPFPHDVRNMSSGDRVQILQFLGAAQPGPQWGEVKQSCPACDREFPLVIDVPTMFRSL